MACPVDGRFTADLFQTAMKNLDLWEAFFCAYGSPMGEIVVGSILYAGIGLNIFIRTGSALIPFVLMLLLGGTILAQMFAVISSIAGIIILVVAPLIVTGIVFAMDRRG